MAAGINMPTDEEGEKVVRGIKLKNG